jgi:subfamily B ATP-binding cassette protein MsbA
MKTFKRLLTFVKPLRHYFPEYMIYSIIGIVFGLVNFAMLIPLLNVLFDTEKPAVPAMPEFSFTINYFKDLFQYHFLRISDTHGELNALGFVCIIIGCPLSRHEGNDPAANEYTGKDAE